MKASEIITRLQALVNEHGDKSVVVSGAYSNGCQIDTETLLPVIEANIFSDSECFQIIADNQ